MAVNTFVPTALANTTPTPDGAGAASVDDPRARQQAQASFEWFDYGQYIPGSGTRWETNPPFKLWEGEKLVPHVISAAAQDGVPAHILRGYIRRAQYNVADKPSKCRLQFLYNPTQITRNYVSYLDQGALDPFNTVYQSGNLVAPPSFMDFTFELFFDRQEEATDPADPGVMIDMDYFDLVVRNVVPASQRTANALPDNGVMMVNPRDITVVFSPSLSIQGRPTNAQVVFQKFTHRMTPTRMTIALTMRVVYLGPVRDMTTFVNEEVNVARRIPFDIKEPQKYGFSYNKIEWTNNGEDIDPRSIVNGTADQLGDMGGTGGALAADVAHRRWQQYGTKYLLAKRAQLWDWADCSSFVWGGFADNRGLEASGTPTTQSMAEKLGWPKWGSGSPTSTAGMFPTLVDRKYAVPIYGGGGLANGLTEGQWDHFKDLKKGDILLRHNNPRKSGGHVAFVWDVQGDKVLILHAASEPKDVEIGTITANSTIYYNYAFRVVMGNEGSAIPETEGTEEEPESTANAPAEPGGTNRKPTAPRNLRAIIATDYSAVTLDWDAPEHWYAEPEQRNYRMDRSRDQVNWYRKNLVGTTDSSYIWPVSESDTYYFRILAGNHHGLGPPSRVVKAVV